MLIEASEKITRNFYYKQVLFGAEKIAKTLTLDDLSETDMEALRSGYFLWLPGRDMAGRLVIQQTARFLDVDNWESHVS